MPYTVSPTHMQQNFNIAVVGCGGTGGFVAEGLCRLLNNSDIPILLIDHDRVEPHNLVRQNFYAGDVGKFKSQALADRLARQFGRRIGYSVYPFDAELVGSELGAGMVTRIAQGIIIGCVDGPEGRRSIASGFHLSNWWIDAGNGISSGQVLIGNAATLEQLQGSFDETSQKVDKLPLPSLQQPSLLAPPTRRARDLLDCAEAVATDEQSPVINQAMANLVLQFIYRLLTDKLTWMGAYIDLEAGTLQTVPAEPVMVARICGVKVDTLIQQGCSIGYRYSMRRR